MKSRLLAYGFSIVVAIATVVLSPQPAFAGVCSGNHSETAWGVPSATYLDAYISAYTWIYDNYVIPTCGNYTPCNEQNWVAQTIYNEEYEFWYVAVTVQWGCYIEE